MKSKASPPNNLRRDLLRWALGVGVFFVLLPAVCLFMAAGQWNWTWAWVYVGLLVANQLATALVLLKTSPDLLAERSQRRADAKAWDRLLIALMALWGPMAMYIVAGLDKGGGWSPKIGPGLQWVGLILALLSCLLGLWAIAANRFFAGVVRIQQERGHRVISGGPYQYVRHPGYLAVILFDLVTPLLLGALWAWLPVFLVIAVVVIRTALEDRTLQAELDGYRAYAQRTRYRLFPGVW